MEKTLLKKRMRETPQMEPVDAVKLVYQSAFGCGHLLSENCVQRVEEELAHVAACGDVPALTPIGGGLGRLNLAAPAVRELPPERIAGMMRVTMFVASTS